METIKISDETYQRLGVYARGFETPDSVITRLLDYFDLQGEPELPDSKTTGAIQSQQGRSYAKYHFEGQLLGKGRLVLAVIKSYCQKHADLSYEALKDAFPDHLQGSLGVIAPLSKAIEIVEKSPRKQRRHFIKPDEMVSLVGGDIAVCTEWGAGNIDNFIEHAKSYGCEIDLDREE